MRTVVAGSRGITEYTVVAQAILDSKFRITTVISGGAAGVDSLGERWAKERGIPVERHLPDWGKNGRAAGLMRNEEMVDCAEALIAVWDGASRGTKYSIDYARKRSIPVFIKVINT